MENYENMLPEEREENNQSLIEDLRRTYRPDFQDARVLTRIRERLLAGEGWQEQRKQPSVALTHTQPQKKPVMGGRQDGNFKTRKLKTGRHALALVAAVLVISFLVGSLVLTLHLARSTSTGSRTVNGRPVIFMSIHMCSTSTGWALSMGDRVLRTTDGGVSWQEVTPPDLHGLETRFSLESSWAFYDAMTAWFAVTVNDQQAPQYHSATAALLYHTVDGGKTWRQTILKLSGLRTGQLIFVNEHVGWLVTMPDAINQGPERDTPFDIWHTSDGGQTWTKILNGSSSRAKNLTGVIAPTISFGDEQVGLMVGQNRSLYRTVDGGVTWRLQSWSAISGNAISFGSPHFFTAKDALFTSTTRTIGSSGLAQTLGVVVYTTHDAGLTWHPSSTFSLAASQDTRAHIGWSPWSGTPMFIDMQHGWISASTEATTTVDGQSNLVNYMTTDGGEHWTQLPISSIPNRSRAGFDYAFSNFISPRVGWINSEGGVLLKTVDGGATWVQVQAHLSSFIQVSSTS